MLSRAHDPEAAAYYAAGYWRRADLWDELDARARAAGERIAVVCDGELSYRALRDAAVAFSERLARSGVRPGELVGLCGRHSLEAVVAVLGCIHRGAVLAPLPPMFNEEQLRALMGEAGAVALVGFGDEASLAKCRGLGGAVPVTIELGAGAAEALAEAGAVAPREAVDPDALFLVLHSSGTTQAAKGVAHSANTLRYASEQVLARWGLGADDRMLVVSEFGFVGGLVFGYLPALLCGATAVLLSRWDPAAALALLERERCTYTLLMPTHAIDILHCPRRSEQDHSSLRVLVAAGLSREQRLAMRDAFALPPLGDYGLSEVPGNAAPAPDAPWEKVLATEGPPYDGTDTRVVDADGASCPPGEPGEIVINGPSRFLGFLGNPQLTAESLTDWGGYRTGDLGSIDADGYLTYLGRSKDIIRRGGVTIVPADVEQAVLRHPAIREVALVGVPDERLGERPCAAVIAKPGERAPDLASLCEFLEREGVAKYAWPERIEVFEDFPRTSSLKAVKRDIVAAVVARGGEA